MSAQNVRPVRLLHMRNEIEIVESAIKGIEGILTLPILEQHKRELLSTMLWKLTEARGKYTTRYRSQAALDPPKGTELQHEHVFERKQLIDEILANPGQARDIAKTAVGCIVTKEEHDRLTRMSRARPDLRGWDRYEAAGIAVVDADAASDQHSDSEYASSE
jgi:hypothetical protein